MAMKKAKKSQKKPTHKAKVAAKKAAPIKNSLGSPYADRVLVKPITPEETTSFGLVLPDSGKEKPEQGLVVAVGPGRRGSEDELIPLGVKVGDTIMFSKYGYDEVKIDGTQYYLIREDSITYIFN